MLSHVLIAENDVLTADVLKGIFSNAGYRVTVAKDGLEALTAFKADPPDLLWTDIQMPYLDGGGLISRVREINPKLPVVILSAYASSDIVDQPNNEPTTVLMKPVCFQGVLSAVRNALSGKHVIAI